MVTFIGYKVKNAYDTGLKKYHAEPLHINQFVG